MALLNVALHDDISGCSMPLSMHLLDLGLILIAYNHVQHTQLRRHATPLIINFRMR